MIVTAIDRSKAVQNTVEEMIQNSKETLSKYFPLRNRSKGDYAICFNAIKIIRQAQFLQSKFV